MAIERDPCLPLFVILERSRDIKAKQDQDGKRIEAEEGLGKITILLADSKIPFLPRERDMPFNHEIFPR